MTYNHFHFVYVFMNDGADLTQTLVGIKAERKLFQAIDDVFAYLIDNVKPRIVFSHVCKYIAAAFYQEAGGQAGPIPKQIAAA